ncbi:MAG: CHAD domain-containing protein [Pirellulales bacterium]|nr:CHAD domain-containing protein [Pirellulales bacterium]
MTPPLDVGYRLLAAQYIHKQARQLAEQFDGARRADDVEFVHRARVASRRLRAAFRMFADCFKAKRLKRWRKHIRRVTTGLGEARDKDVQIEWLGKTLASLEDKACCDGVARLLVRLEQQRERLQPKVTEAADRLQASGVLGEMQAAAKRILAEAKAGESTMQSPAAFRQIERHILNHLGQLLSYQDSLARPEDKQRHHAMRIAAKRLRYTMEISGPVYVGAVSDAISVAKKLQNLLGEVHDCDVWDEHLRDFAARQRKRIVKYFGHPEPFARLEVGIEHLRNERRQRRRQVFHELGEYWQDLSRREYWGVLVAAVKSRGRTALEPAAASDPAAETAGSQNSGDGGPDVDGGPNGDGAGECTEREDVVGQDLARRSDGGANRASEPRQPKAATAQAVREKAISQ